MEKTHILILLIISAVTVSNAAEFFFKDGDKVVMMGDSITQQYLYSSYVERWALTRFPDRNITFLNIGIGGDTANGYNVRFKRDVLPNTPTVMTVDYGMNDGHYRAFDEEGFRHYKSALQAIANQAKAANIRIAWLTTNPVEPKEDGPALQGYNLTLEKYAEGVKQIAATNGDALFVDQFHPFLSIIDKARTANPKNRIGKEPVHPTPEGHAVMAWSILKGMSFPPIVASAEIDAASGNVGKTINCKIDGLNVDPTGKVAFIQLDSALPFFPQEAKGILKWAPLLEELNDYHLKVIGLKDGQYEVRLDGKKVAGYTNVELRKGVNLAAAVLEEGPIADQVNAVTKAVKEKNDYYHGIFHGVIIARAEIPDFLGIKIDIEEKRASVLKERMPKLQEYFKAIRTTLVLKPHQVEIVPVIKP